MPTRIQRVSIANGSRDPPLFCLESPIQVFTGLYQTHKILSYQSVPFPASEYNEWLDGLRIRKVEAAKGTTIIGNYQDFEAELEKARITPRDIAGRTDQTYLKALKNAFQKSPEDPRSCFKQMNLGKEYWIQSYDQYVVPLLEVGSVTLGIENLTFPHLEELLEE